MPAVLLMIAFGSGRTCDGYQMLMVLVIGKRVCSKTRRFGEEMRNPNQIGSKPRMEVQVRHVSLFLVLLESPGCDLSAQVLNCPKTSG